jgi:hypothetical protein
MEGTLHHATPPGWLTATEAAEKLGMFRQSFHQMGYAKMFDRWKIGPGYGTLLYRAQDIANLARWLVVRKGLVGLGLWAKDHAYVPEDGEFHTAVEEGYWDVDCPKCSGDAVGYDDRVWCPECGYYQD